MNKKLLSPEVKRFVLDHYKQDPTLLLFKGSPFPDVNVQELVTQIIGKAKVEKKLPTWFKNNDVIYPTTLNLEQTSSEMTAKYKASLISGKTLADITGGFGIDTFFFSKIFDAVHHVEINSKLSEIAAHNFKVLGRNNISSISSEGIDFLKDYPDNFDWIYIDPSRRDDVGGRVFFLSDCLPNVPENLNFLFQKTNNILLKTSPLLDISAGILALKNVAEIHIIAVKNEVKELLWLLKKNSEETIKIKTINFKKTKREIFETTFEENQKNINYNPPLSYLYEPNAAIMKSGMFGSLSQFFNLKKLHANSHLFTSETIVSDFPGRIFKIEKVLDYQKKRLKTQLNFDKANIATRNFPLSVTELKKQLKIADGGEIYLFFTTTESERKIVLICRKF